MRVDDSVSECMVYLIAVTTSVAASDGSAADISTFVKVKLYFQGLSS